MASHRSNSGLIHFSTEIEGDKAMVSAKILLVTMSFSSLKKENVKVGLFFATLLSIFWGVIFLGLAQMLFQFILGLFGGQIALWQTFVILLLIQIFQVYKDLFKKAP